MMARSAYTLFIVCLLCAPAIAAADVRITEIMYAPESTDADHEWIEVCASDGDHTLDGWVFYENETNHGLELVSGLWSLESGTCAIIADDATTFQDDYPSVSGTLIDSAFSLKNTGETLALKNAAGDIVDSVTYSESDGAANDGNSLHRDGDALVAGTPTPNEAQHTGETGDTTDTNDTNTNETDATVTNITQYTYEPLSVEPPQDVHLRLPEQIVGVAGAPIALHAEMYDARGRALTNGVVRWAFGDGTEAVGYDVRHAYRYAGEYVITATLEHGALRDEHTITARITQLDAALRIGAAGKWIAITNHGNAPLDLSEWRVRSPVRTAELPIGTTVAASSTIRLATEVLELPFVRVDKEASLLFPDGSTALVGTVVSPQATTTETTSPATSTNASPPRSMQKPTNPQLTTSRSHNALIGTPVPQQSPSPAVDAARASINRDTSSLPTASTQLRTTNPTRPTTTHSQLAATAHSSKPTAHSSFWWYLALTALILTGGAGMLLARRSTDPADEFTIEEKT